MLEFFQMLKYIKKIKINTLDFQLITFCTITEATEKINK